MKKVFTVAFCLARSILLEGCSEAVLDDYFYVDGDVLLQCSTNYEGVVVLPRRVKHIGDCAFINCRKVTGIELHDSLQTVGESAFYGCVHLQEVVLPESVTNVGPRAFAGCTSLTNAVIRADIDRIPDMFFDRCIRLRRVEFPCGLFDVGESAFAKCRSLKSVALPDSVTNISRSAFFACSRLERFISPGKLLSIGATAFAKCYDLRFLVFSKHVKTIGIDAFMDDLSCNGIVIQGDIPGSALDQLRDCSRQIYQVGSAQQESPSGNAEGSWTTDVSVVKCRAIEDAVRACETTANLRVGESFPGLTRVLRIAVDGFSEQTCENRVDLLKMDEFTAHIPELVIGMSVENIRKYVGKRASTSVSFSLQGEVSVVSAHFGVYNSSVVGVEMAIQNAALIGIKLSTGLKDGVLLGLKASGVSPNETDLLWLE